MSGFSVADDDHLVRSNIWSREVKDVLEDELMGMRYVRLLSDFTDGETFNIPSIGQAEVLDYAEGESIKYSSMDTGNFTMTVDQYKSSATFITNKMKQDSFYMSELVSSFVPKQARALAKSIEVRVFERAYAGQTAASTNTINGAFHRYVGSGTSETIDIVDFAKAAYALQRAQVPLNNLVAIIDPSAAFKLATMTNLVNLNNNKAWEGIVRTGGITGTRFIANIYGFDVYCSENLYANTAAETIASGVGGANLSTAVGAVNNVFFSATPDILPWVGVVRQPPKVDSEYNKDEQRDEYVTTCRYAFKLFRPENMVVVVTDTDAVY
jgi:hypothetical protein